MAEQVPELPEITADILARVFESAPLGVCVLGAFGTVKWHNSQLRKLVSDGMSGALQGRCLGAVLSEDADVALTSLLSEIRDGLRRSARFSALTVGNGIAGSSRELRIFLVALRPDVRGATALCMVEPASSVPLIAASTPMNAVVGLSTLLLQTELSREQRRFVEALRDSGDSMLALIDDVLDMSKLVAGDLELKPLAFDLEQVVAAVADDFAMRAKPDVQVVVAHAPPDLGRLIGDPVRIRQILANYLSNAVRVTVRGHILVSVKVEEDDGELVCLRLSVEDTGCGVPHGATYGLFSQYEGDVAQRGPNDGGLGLAISRELAQLMNGSVGAMSEPGVGSTFWARCVVPKEAVDTVVDSEVPPPLAPAARLKKVRVLVADSCEASRYALRQTLGRFGAVVSTCSSARDGLDALLQARAKTMEYDVLLLGHALDDMPGDALARVLRADGSMGHLAMIKLVPAAADEDSRTLAGRGYRAALREPVHQRPLLELMAELPQLPRLVAPKVAPPPLRRRVLTPHVLVVDGDEKEGARTGRQLEQLGCRVTLASGDQEAVHRLREDEFDLVLVDGSLGAAERLEKVAALRRRGGSSSFMPILAMREPQGMTRKRRVTTGPKRAAPPAASARAVPQGFSRNSLRTSPRQPLVELIDRFAPAARIAPPPRHTSSAH